MGVITKWEGNVVYIDNVPYAVTARVLNYKADLNNAKYFMVGAEVKSVKKTPDGKIDMLKTVIGDTGNNLGHSGYEATSNAKYKEAKASKYPVRASSESRNYYCAYAKDIVVAFVEKGSITDIQQAKMAWREIYRTMWAEVSGEPNEDGL